MAVPMKLQWHVASLSVITKAMLATGCPPALSSIVPTSRDASGALMPTENTVLSEARSLCLTLGVAGPPLTRS